MIIGKSREEKFFSDCFSLTYRDLCRNSIFLNRQESDWLVGINCTRAQTLVMRRAGGDGVYSIGRTSVKIIMLEST
jgi:DNA topoisomerase IA